MAPLMLLMLVALAKSQETTPDYTVTYNPGQDCLPYDGSVVPDCKKFVDPITKWPYYHPHSTNCSRFWECGPEGETCMFECMNCQNAIGDNSQCAGRWALSFDASIQFPDGPVCNWPGSIDCSRAVCDETDPRPECCEDFDCKNTGSDEFCPDAYCSTNFNCVNTCQEETTTTSSGSTTDYTVTYVPEVECLPYDGSVVPDCSKFVNPITKWPYYHEHSTNCSRFWECGPNLELCLVECANCQHELGQNANCEGRWALAFDREFQYPDGPVCQWPADIDCSAAVCDEMDPRPECCLDLECQNVGSSDYCPDAYCSTSFNCVYPDSCP